MYFVERFIIVSVWLISFISIWFIPKEYYHQASFIFLFTQLPSWIFGLLVVEAGLIEYPVRELYRANVTSFTFEYLVLPIMCIFFNMYFPQNKGSYNKIIYYLTILSPFTLIEYFTEKHTLILKYIHWQWYTTFITMGILIYFVRSVYKWFFNLGKPFSL
jgi:uncharacterized membrane protein